MEISMKQVIEAMKANGLHDEAAAVGLVMEQRAELLEALIGVMYWDNGKSEWDIARQAIANTEK